MRVVESDNETGVNAEFAATSAGVRSVLHQDLKDCGKSRGQVAFELSEAVGKQISVEAIDAFVAPSKPHRFPAEWIPAWVKVTGSRQMLALLCESLGLSLASEEDREFAELGRASLRADALRQKLWARSY